MNGVTFATFFVLPFLGKHPDEYPRFRDCFVGRVTRSKTKDDQFGIPTMESDHSDVITVYTRTGGGNRENYKSEIESMRAMPGFIDDCDDSFDNTFASFVFKVPEEWRDDFDLVVLGKIIDTSQEYKKLVDKVYPKLKGKLPWHSDFL